MKKQADKMRSEREFKVVDMVFFKLQPYVQSSLALRSNQKLAFKFFGPYPVVSKLGKVAYRLKLPESSSIYPVFHVFQLKLAVTLNTVISSLSSEFDWPRIPELVLQNRVLERNGNQVQQVLVKWSNWTEELATWEDRMSLQTAISVCSSLGSSRFSSGGE